MTQVGLSVASPRYAAGFSLQSLAQMQIDFRGIYPEPVEGIPHAKKIFNAKPLLAVVALSVVTLRVV